MAYFLTLAGRKKALKNIEDYRLDFDDSSLSKFQFSVKQFLRGYWLNHVLYEELPVVGTRMRIDIYNATRRIAIECDGAQHNKYNKHFHRGSRNVYLGQIIRDEKKDEWCKLNQIELVRIYEEDVPSLSREWFREQGVEL